MDWNNLLDWPEYVKLFAGMLALVNPVGCLPVFASLTQGLSRAQKQRTALAAVGFTTATLLIFAFLGEVILFIFGITIDAFRIAGGLVLLYVGLEMLGGRSSGQMLKREGAASYLSVAVVPLAIPLLSGPAAITGAILFTHAHASLTHDLLVAAAVLSVSALTLLLLWLAPLMERRLQGGAGATIFTRVMGLILLAIAVEFIIDGLGAHFPGLLG